jgi:protein-tyrosine-phosphatase
MKILFICRANWFRSQIAAAVYNQLTATQDADSAGTYVGAPGEPEGLSLSALYKNQVFFEVMEVHGLHLRDNVTRLLRPEMLAGYAKIISMAEEPYVPSFLKTYPNVTWWDVENPTTVNREVVEGTYQKINGLVSNLISSTHNT